MKITITKSNSRIDCQEKSQNNFNNILLIKNKKFPNEGKLVTKDSLLFIKKFNKPVEPVLQHNNEDLARIKLENYKPSILDKILGAAKIELKWLNYLVKIAMNEDLKEYELEYKEYLLDLDIWEKTEHTSEIFNDEISSLNYTEKEGLFSKFQNCN